MQTMTRYPIEELWVDSVSVVPVSIDWSEAYDRGDEPGWESFEAPECPDCGSYGSYDRDEYEWRCTKVGCGNRDALETGDLSGPMMSYYYPLPDLNRVGDEYDAAEAISDLPLCVVTFEDGTHALALTGGGMDLSWEIAEAFTRLGFLPPLHFCDLPAMSGYPRTDEHRHTIAACRRSCDVAEHQAARTRERLAQFGA